MATSAFKSTSRRGTAVESKGPPPAAASRRRSHSVSAVSRKTRLPLDDNASISSGFSNSRDNPLFWATSSPPDKESPKTSDTGNGKLSHSLSARNARNSNGGGGGSYGEQRGRSATRNSSDKKGIGRSLSRIRGRSVSTAHYNGVHEGEKDRNMAASTFAQSRNESKRNGNGISRTSSARNIDKQGHVKDGRVRTSRIQAATWSDDESACSLQISNLEDGISVGSISEAEEKTIIEAFEELTNQAYRRNSTNVADMPSDSVNADATELISDIRREYAIKLEESEERARKLRTDLAIEEHRGQELDRILKEIRDPETPGIQRSRRGRRTSNGRKCMSKRLTEEAMTYFDECVSLSTFDSSDFSASEDLLHNSVRTTGPGCSSSLVEESPGTIGCYDQGSPFDTRQILDDRAGSAPTTDISSAGPGNTQIFQFSFAHKGSENTGPQEDIRSYIKNFERCTKKDIDWEGTSSYYDDGVYSTPDYAESLLIERVLCKSQMESGRLLLCGGDFSFLPFASAV